jgi:hypothetical protein
MLKVMPSTVNGVPWKFQAAAYGFSLSGTFASGSVSSE